MNETEIQQTAKPVSRYAHEWRGNTILYVLPDELLGKILGSTEALTTGQMQKKLWIYIKANCKTEKRQKVVLNC